MVLLCFVTKSVCSAQERMVGKYHDNFFVQVKQVYCYRIVMVLRRLHVPSAAAPLIISLVLPGLTERKRQDMEKPCVSI